MTKLVLLSLVLCACTSSSDNEIVGQVKKIVKKTPLVCPDYTEVHVSLGVIRQGVGSMSHEDVMVAVDNSEKEVIEKLKYAVESGSIVKLQYDVKRVSPCWPDHRLVGMPILEETPPPAVQPPTEAPKP